VLHWCTLKGFAVPNAFLNRDTLKHLATPRQFSLLHSEGMTLRLFTLRSVTFELVQRIDKKVHTHSSSSAATSPSGNDIKQTLTQFHGDLLMSFQR